MIFKILEYNILNGLCNEQKPYAFDEKRFKSALKVIEDAKPDILILCEAGISGVTPVTSNYNSSYEHLLSEFFGLDRARVNDFRCAPAIFSRFPMSAKNPYTDKHRGYIRSSLRLNDKTINLDVVHPSPKLSEEQRTKFFKDVLKTRSESRYIISGDFNSLSPDDCYDQETLTRGYGNFMEEDGKAKVEDMMKASAMSCVLESRLRDTYAAKNPTRDIKKDFTIPTDWRNKNKDSAVRLDYILCSYDFNVKDAGIIKNEFSEEASDHYPIYAVLEF